MPISGSILAVLLGEHFTTSLAIGLILVCLSIVLINRPSQFKKLERYKETRKLKSNNL